MKISIIVAVSENNVIGKDGKIPWHIPEDLKHFKEITMGHHIMMGRNTFESIGHPLPGRVNLVISSNPLYSPEGVSVFRSIEEAVVFAKTAGEDELIVIGGESIYKSMLPLADTIYLTKVSKSCEGNVISRKLITKNGPPYPWSRTPKTPTLNSDDWKEGRLAIVAVTVKFISLFSRSKFF